MVAVMRDTDFSTRAIVDGRVVNTYKAKDLLQKISEATWQCGDPGMQYDTTVNRWHTSKNTARINASNPCSEYMFLDDSACNLASLNLLKFAPNGTFDVEAYRHAVDVVITAQEILVDNAGYPTEIIGKNSHDYRPLGLGYANLGALVNGRGPALRQRRRKRLRRLRNRHHVRRSLSPVVENSRTMRTASPITDTVQTRLGVTTAENMPGAACPGWYINREPFLDVIRMHRASVNNIGSARRGRIRPPRSEAPRSQLLSYRSLQAMLGRSPFPRRKARLP